MRLEVIQDDVSECALFGPVFGLLSNTPRVLLSEIYKFVLIEDSLEENHRSKYQINFSDDSQPLTFIAVFLL